MPEKSTNALLLKHPTRVHRGYALQALYALSGAPLGWDGMVRMQRVPGKLTAVIDRAQVAEVRHFRATGPRFQYFVKAVNGHFFELEF